MMKEDKNNKEKEIYYAIKTDNGYLFFSFFNRENYYFTEIPKLYTAKIDDINYWLDKLKDLNPELIEMNKILY